MKITVAWKTFDNVQTKNFKNESDAIAWIRKNCENIMSINGIPTYGENISHFDIMNCFKGEPLSFPASSAKIAEVYGFGIPS